MDNPKEDNSTDLSERQKRSAANGRRLDELLLPKAEKSRWKRLTILIWSTSSFATPRRSQKDLGTADDGRRNGGGISKVIAQTKRRPLPIILV